MTSNNKDVSPANKLRGRLYIVAAALMWSSGGFFAKAPLFSSWDGETRGLLLAFWRTLFGGIVLLPFVRQFRWGWRVLPLVLAFALMNITYLSAMSLSEASIAIWLQSTAPVWVFAGGVLWFREQVRPRDWVMLAFCLAGVATILVFELRNARFWGVSFGLGAGLFYGGIVLCLRRLRDYDVFWLIGLSHVATAVALAPAVVVLNAWPTMTQILMLIGFGVFQMGIPYVLFSRGLRFVAGHEASCIALLEPIVLPLWVYLAWGSITGYEPPAIWTLIGGGLILTGLLIRYVGPTDLKNVFFFDVSKS